MPSLNALGEFKFSFSNIANEKNDLASKNLPYNDLTLPTVEAPEMDYSRPAPPSAAASAPAPAETAPADIAPAPGGLDFSDFAAPVDSISHLDEPPSIDDLFSDLVQPSSVTDTQSSAIDEHFPAAEDEQSGPDEQPPVSNDQFSAADDDLFGSEEPSASADEQALSDDFFNNLGSTPPEETPDTDDFLSNDDFSVPSQEPATDSSFDTSDLPDFGEQPAAESSFDTGDLPDFGEQPAADSSFDTSDLPDFGEQPAADSSFDTSDLPDFGEQPAADSSFDTSDLPDLGEQPAADSSFETGDLPDLGEETPSDLPIEEPGHEDAAEDSIDMGGESFNTNDAYNKSDENPFGDFDAAPDFGEPSREDAAEDSIDMGGEAPEPGASSDFDSPLPDTDFPSTDFDSPLPDTDFPSTDLGSDFETPLPDTDFSPDSVLPADADSSGADSESFGDFSADFGSDFASESIELENELGAPDAGLGSEGFKDSDLGGDDFALPGLEEIFDKSKTDTTPKPAPKKGLFKRKKAKTDDLPEAEAGIDEIRLSQNDLDKLLKTLAAYPLNLRIVCEEMIAEQVLLPQQLSKLVRMLVNGAPVREMAALAQEITGKPIVIPKSFEKMTGAAFEAEQSSFAYIFIHNFLPVLRLFAIIAALAASVFYLSYRFIYIPIKAEGLYKRGYERIPAGEYQRANQLFNEAFLTHRNKKWFYRYAEAFRDERRYLLAEEKYDELLRYYPRDKKGVLDYAHLQTYYLLNYDKANRLLQQQLLDYAPNDYDGLLAAGDNFLLWADSDPSKYYDKYEDARFMYARVLELYGWQVPVAERMLRYFIRTDNLKEVLYMRIWFENDTRRVLSPASLAELGGYLLDKQLAVANGEVKGVPDPYIDSIESVRDMLLKAVRGEPTLPEPHYHLARYYNNLGNTYEERLTLENAIRAFDLAQTETVRRRQYRVDTHYRYANLLINNREFFPAEEQLVRGIQLYEDFLSRNLISAGPQLGKLYAVKGDLEYFVKSGDINAVLDNYRLAERYGYAPPEIQYRMGAAYYNLQDWRNSLEYMFKAAAELPLNRRLLYALGNVTYQRGDYFAAQGYYDRLLDTLESQRVRLPVLLPNDNPQFLELGERMMMARNNAGVVYEALAEQTGNREFRSKAMSLYAESARAWDAITRDPETMIRSRVVGTPGSPGVNLGFLNSNNAMRPNNNYSPEIFIRIDKDALEPSKWEELSTTGGLQ